MLLCPLGRVQSPPPALLGRGHAEEQPSSLDPSMQAPHHSLPAGLSLDDFIPGYLLAHVGSSARGTRVPVIRNGGSNTLNFQFHDPAPRTVCNGYLPPRRDASRHPDPAWYQTWPGPGNRPPGNQKTPASQHSQKWSATWTKDSKRRDKRWVKYEGIGPVDESGMPIAPRSSVDSPRDWYRRMFKQIHRKMPDLQLDWTFEEAPKDSRHPGPQQRPPARPNQTSPLSGRSWDVSEESLRSTFSCSPGAPSSLHQTSKQVLRRRDKADNVWTEESWNQFLQELETGQKPKKPLVDDPVEKPSQPIEVLLERELAKLSAELDKDLRAIETGLPCPKSSQAPRRSREPRPPARPASAWSSSSPNALYPSSSLSPHRMADGGSPFLGRRDFVYPSSTRDPSASDPGGSPARKEEKKRKAARLKFDFQAQSPKELTLKKGDIVYIHKEVDKNWLEGEHHGRLGIFPANYVEVLPADEIPKPIKPPTYQVLEYGEAVAQYNFKGDLEVELSFRKALCCGTQASVTAHGFYTQQSYSFGIYKATTPHPERAPPPFWHAAHLHLSTRSRPQTQSLSTPGSALSHPGSSSHPLDLGTSSSSTTEIHWTPYRAMYQYRPQNEDELELREGDRVDVMQQCDDGWFVGVSRRTQKFGTFPGNYVAPV
ncbi:vinexin [Moschus berezovskii]|uniref:vinexin n=1 Tax=Moschus berezovskii TaxID=68408 RepID=UPI002443F7C9|nr:vinexin [Moschus berezovskii]